MQNVQRGVSDWMWTQDRLHVSIQSFAGYESFEEGLISDFQLSARPLLAQPPTIGVDHLCRERVFYQDSSLQNIQWNSMGSLRKGKGDIQEAIMRLASCRMIQ